jgi:hypothetical protein
MNPIEPSQVLDVRPNGPTSRPDSFGPSPSLLCCLLQKNGSGSGTGFAAVLARQITEQTIETAGPPSEEPVEPTIEPKPRKSGKDSHDDRKPQSCRSAPHNFNQQPPKGCSHVNDVPSGGE